MVICIVIITIQLYIPTMYKNPGAPSINMDYL